jgi:hypothetical protein
MTLMKTVLIICSYILIYSSLQAQDVVFKQEISQDTILLGNVLEIRYTIENTQGDFQAPDFDGMTVVSGPNVSSQFSMINGKVSQSSSYTYFLMPQDVGTYQIHQANLENGENTWSTEPMTIIVLPNPDGIINQSKGFRFRQEIIVPQEKMSPQDSIQQKLKKLKTYKI